MTRLRQLTVFPVWSWIMTLTQREASSKRTNAPAHFSMSNGRSLTVTSCESKQELDRPLITIICSFLSARSSIQTAQRYLAFSKKQTVVTSETNAQDFQSRIVQNLISSRSQIPNSASSSPRNMNERLLTAPRPLNCNSDENIPQYQTDLAAMQALPRAQTQDRRIRNRRNTRTTTSVVKIDNKVSEYPLTPSIFDGAIEQQSPFGQTFNVMPSSTRSQPVKVFYQTGYSSNSRLYDQARRKQLKQRYLLE